MKRLILFAALLAIAAIGARAQDADATTREGQRTLIDTNATTTVTLYAPSAAGQLLVGKVATSNAVWISTAANTNSWVKIAQTAP